MTPGPSFRSLIIRLLAVLALVAAGLVLLVPSASAANLSFSQCNGFENAGAGATTKMDCDIEVINTINGPNRSAVLKVTRSCANDACPAGSNTGAGNTGPVTTTYVGDLITSISQCNDSANLAAIDPMTCNVKITNNISADTPGAQPLAFATLNQCNGSAQGAPAGTNSCNPPSASTSGATVTQCNGSANGGGGTIDCFFDTTDQVSPALPVTVNQCNNTGNPGGSRLICNTQIITTITAAYSTGSTGGTGGTSSGGSTGSSSGGSTGSSSGGSSGSRSGGTTGSSSGGTTSGGLAGPSPSSGGVLGQGAEQGSGGGPTGLAPTTGGQVTTVPRGGVAAGGGSTSRGDNGPLLAVGVLLLTAAAVLGLRGRARH